MVSVQAPCAFSADVFLFGSCERVYGRHDNGSDNLGLLEPNLIVDAALCKNWCDVHTCHMDFPCLCNDAMVIFNTHCTIILLYHNHRECLG